MSTVLRGPDLAFWIQTRLAEAGFYTGQIDGVFGGMSQGAQLEALAAARAARDMAELDPSGAEELSIVEKDPRLCWGGKVSRVFRDRVHWIAEDLGMPAGGADDLMACMAWESGRTFRSDIRNMAGSGATGLIQFMPLTALHFFHSAAAIQKMTQAQKLAHGRAACDRLAGMTAEDQLNYVYKYFRPWKGRLQNLGDIYMAILWPAGVGRPDSFVLWEKGKSPITYRQNAGLDIDKDERITRAEALAKVTALRAEGFRAGNVWAG